MPNMDFFGLKKDLKENGGGKATKEKRPGKSREFWTILLAADVLIIVLSVGLLGWRYHFWKNHTPPPTAVKTAAAQKPAHPDKKVVLKKTAKAAPKKPAAKKAVAPKKPSFAKKEPLGSPALHSPGLPRRMPKPAGRKKAAAKKERPIPVTFDYIDPAAKKVYLIGAFLIGHNGKYALKENPKKHGHWSSNNDLWLKRGVTYRYQFKVIDLADQEKLTPVQDKEVR